MRLPPGRQAYFERLYAADPDPWDFETSWYEQRKYALTVAALPEPRYRSGFEPGCSVGVLTELLAARCDALLATDLVAAAVERAAGRLAAHPHVRVRHQSLADAWPDERLDLVVLSEIAYYFEADALAALAARAVAGLEVGGTLLAVHWRGPTDYALSGDAAHRILDAAAGLQRRARHLEDDFVLDVWTAGR